MPKAKSRKIISKRFKFTKTGKVKRMFSRTSHRKRIDDSSARSRKDNVGSVVGRFAKKLKLMVINN